MDATKWLTNVAIAYHDRYPTVSVEEIYAELYRHWCAKLPEIELIQYQSPERVRRIAGAALKRWALAYCQKVTGHIRDRYHVHYGRGQVRSMLPSLAAMVDITPFATGPELERVKGGRPKHEGNDGLAAYADLRRGWTALPEDQQRVLATVFMFGLEQDGYPQVMAYFGCSYEAARKRVERALTKLLTLMGNERMVRVYVDLEAEIEEGSYA